MKDQGKDEHSTIYTNPSLHFLGVWPVIIKNVTIVIKTTKYTRSGTMQLYMYLCLVVICERFVSSLYVIFLFLCLYMIL